MIVTALAEHPRRPGRYLLSLDGEKRGSISLELIAECRLKVGRAVAVADVAALERGLRETACYDKALDTLGARARSGADLRRYLKTKEFTDAEIAPVLEKLQALGLLDDRAYARTFARTRLAPSRGFGPRRVAAELARKGVARAVVDEVLAEWEAERREEAEAREGADGAGGTGGGDGDDRGAGRSAVELAAAKKLRTLAKVDDETRRRRLYAYLARRGFANAEIRRVLDRLRSTTPS